MTVKEDLDKTSRKKIETITDKNYFVEAGAGSGKTYELVKRMVAMVEKGIDVSKICTITFTKAAANEFYARFQEALTQSKSEKAQKALQDIDLCFMGTIDSFCNMVLSEHPLEAGIPSNATIIDEDEMSSLCLREYSLIQQGKKTIELRDKCRRFKKCFYNANEIFATGVKILIGTRNAHLNYTVPEDGEPDDIFKDYKEGIVGLLSKILEHPECAETEKAPGDAFLTLQDKFEVISDSWNDNLSNVIKALKDISKIRVLAEFEDRVNELGPHFDDYFVPHLTRGKLAWYELDPDRKPFEVQKLENYQFSVALDFISDCVNNIADTLRQEGKLSFFDYLLYLRDLLKRDAANGGKLIEHIYNRHSYFLIDEFQDTDPLQTEVFFLLTAKTPNPDWRKCKPKAGSLFIVGDPKQSIYRFKNADVASFLRTKSMFSDPDVGEALELTRNFRSSDNICSWFNDVFAELLPVDTPIQSKYKPIPLNEKCKYKGTLAGAYKYDINYHQKLADNEDFKKVADIIHGIVRKPEITIQDKDTIKDDIRIPKDPRMVEFSDIMLITPSKSHLTQFMQVFSEEGIPFYVEGKTVFNECPALISLAALMRAVADPFDIKAVFTAVNLSGCEITKEEIFEYNKISKAVSPASMFNMLLDDKEIFARAGVTNAEYIYFALELLRSAEVNGTVASIKEGACFINELIESSGTERCLQLVQDSNRVHIANLHKVKGLEAPVVILADSSKKKSSASSRVDYSTNPPESYLFAFSNAVKTDAYPQEKEAEEEVRDSEIIRLQYVAATRAANAIIVANLHMGKAEREEKLIWNDFIRFINQNIDDVIKTGSNPKPCTGEAGSIDSLYLKAKESSVLNDRDSEKTSYDIKRPSMIQLKGKTSAEDNYEDLEPEDISKSKRKENAALIGTMVHKLMEFLVASKGNVADHQAIAEILKEYDANEPDYKEMLYAVSSTIRKGGFEQSQDSKVSKDILKELIFADEVYCELPFCYKDETTIWNGVMDVVFRKDDKWYIVDYKTNYEADDLDEKYQSQLEAYKKAFKEMTGNEADALIYHIKM